MSSARTDIITGYTTCFSVSEENGLSQLAPPGMQLAQLITSSSAEYERFRLSALVLSRKCMHTPSLNPTPTNPMGRGSHHVADGSPPESV